uniref:BHLH domain-containing protein n=1 Tax=Globodera rostochiensis TaxID=31243 RepID=A0A914HRC0_GLORO
MIEGVQQVSEGTLGTGGEADVAKVPNPPMPPNLSPSSSSSSSFTFVSDPFLVLDNDLDDVSEVIKHNIMTDESSGDSTPSHSRLNKCSDNETPTDKRWIQMEMTPPNSFDPCKEREIGQIVSLLQQPDPPSLEEPSPQHLQPQFVLNNDHLEYLSAGISGLEARMPPQGMFTGQKDPMISGGDNGMSPILQLKTHHLTGEQFCDMGIELEQCPQQQHVVLQHHNVHYSHNNMPFPTSHAIDGTPQIQHFVVQDNGTVILDNKGIHMESPPPLVLEQQQNIKEEMLFAPSDNAFGHHRSLQVVVEHAPYDQRAEASDVVKNELIRLLLEMSPQELEQLRTQRALEYQQHQQHLLYSQQQKFQTQTCHPQQLQLEHPLVQLQNITPAQQLQHKYSSNGTEHNMLLIHAPSSNSFCPSGSINSPTLTSPNAFQSVAPSEYFGEEDSAVEEICWTEGETAMDTSREEDALVEVGKLTEAAQRHNDGTTPTGRRRGHKTERRTAHNLIEKKYRCSINDRINQLKEMLSTEESANKLSKSATLRRAVDHIFALRTKNSELGRENVRLRKTLQMAGLAPPERQTMALVKQEVRMGEVRTTGNGVLQNKAPRGGIASMRRSNTVGGGGSITSGQAKDQSRVTLCVFMFLLLAFNPLSTLFFTNEAADGSEQYLQHNIGTSAEPGIFVHHRTLLGDDRFSAAFSEGSVPLASSSPPPLSSSSPGGWWPVRPFFRHFLIWLLNSLFVFLILTRLLVYGEPVADRHFLCSTANCRRRAEMAVASGNYKEAQRELGESLKILQRPLPCNGSVDEWMSLTWQIIRHLLNGLWIGRWFARRRRPSVPHQSVCRSHAATALVYHQLHQLHLLDVDGIRLTSRGALNLALLATNLAESAGSPAIPHSFRAEIYLCAALRSILCMPKCLRRVVAAYFFRRAKRHTRKSADLEGCRLNSVQWTFHPLARQFLSCTERVGAILSQSGVQKTPNFPFSAFAQPPKPLEVLKDSFKMHLLGQLLCRLESSDGGTLRLADFVEQSQLLLNICEGGNAGGAAESTAEDPKNEGTDGKIEGDYDVPCYTDKDMLRPILIAEGDELCAWWTYLVTGGLHWRHGDSVRAQRHYSLVRKFPRELAQNDLALAVGLAFCTRKMCFEDREKDKFAEVVVWHVRRANAHLKRDDWPTMGRDRAGTLEGMLPRGKAPDGSVSILKKKFRILCCQWLLCSLLDVWSFRFAHCGLVAPLEVRRLYAEVMGRIGREGEANEEKMAMFRELGKTLCGLHQLGNQLSALQEGNAPDGGGPTKSNAPRQSETEDA